MSWSKLLLRVLLVATLCCSVLSRGNVNADKAQAGRSSDAKNNASTAIENNLEMRTLRMDLADSESELEASAFPIAIESIPVPETPASEDDEGNISNTIPPFNPTITGPVATATATPAPSNTISFSTVGIDELPMPTEGEIDFSSVHETEGPSQDERQDEETPEISTPPMSQDSRDEESQSSPTAVNGYVLPTKGSEDEGDGIGSDSSVFTEATDGEHTKPLDSASDALPTADSETPSSMGSSLFDGLSSLIPKSPGRPSGDLVVDNQMESSANAKASPDPPTSEGEESNSASKDDVELFDAKMPVSSTEPYTTSAVEPDSKPKVTLPVPHKHGNGDGTKASEDGSLDEYDVIPVTPLNFTGEPENEERPEASSNWSESLTVFDSLEDAISSVDIEPIMPSEEPVPTFGPIVLQNVDPAQLQNSKDEGDILTPSPSLDGFFDSFDITLGIPENTEQPEASENPFEIFFSPPELADGSPKVSTEAEIEPSVAPEDLVVELFVNHPVDFSPEALAEDIRDISNEFIEPEDWDVGHVIPLSEFSKFSSLSPAVRQSENNEDRKTFEVVLKAVCTSNFACNGVTDSYHTFVRNQSMDKALASHDFGQVNVYVKGDKMNERVEPTKVEAGVGLGAGVIAGIVVGAIAMASVLLLGVVFMLKRRGGQDQGFDREDDFGDEIEDGYSQSNRQNPEEGGSFLISNFGGSMHNASDMVPWTSNSERSASGSAVLNEDSFISINTDASGESGNSHPSGYQYGETTSSSSGSEMGHVAVDNRASHGDE